MSMMKTPNHHRRSSLFAAMLAAVLASPLAAQSPADAARVREALPEPAAELVLERVASAADAGLPVGPLVDKALEGAAKRVPTDRLIAVLDQLTRQLEQARVLLTADGGRPADVAMAAVADALRRGVPSNAVAALRLRLEPEQPMALAVHTLGDLLDREVPVPQALDVLTAWDERGGSLETLAELTAAVDRLVNEGLLPDQAAAAVAAAMRRGRPPLQVGMPPGLDVPQGPPGGHPPVPPGLGPPDERGRGNAPGGPPPQP